MEKAKEGQWWRQWRQNELQRQPYWHSSSILSCFMLKAVESHQMFLSKSFFIVRRG